MSLINLLWQLDITDTTKYALIILTIILIISLCYYKNKNYKKHKKGKNNKKINNNVTDEYYKEYAKRENITPCHKHYMNCVENNERYGKNNFCYPCINDGLKQDFFYDPVTQEWLSRDMD